MENSAQRRGEGGGGGLIETRKLMSGEQLARVCTGTDARYAKCHDARIVAGDQCGCALRFPHRVGLSTRPRFLFKRADRYMYPGSSGSFWRNHCSRMIIFGRPRKEAKPCFPSPAPEAFRVAEKFISL